jgi:hypothetical protein
VNSIEEKASATRAPRSGLQLMALILVAMAGLAIYSNVQKARRAQIETVTIAPAAPVLPSPSLSPSP